MTPALAAELDRAHSRMGDAIRERDRCLARGAECQAQGMEASARTYYGMAGEACGALLDARLEIGRIARRMLK